MKIKKYTGETSYEAMLKLKNELGQDAVILSTKEIKGKGFLGFFKKPIVEVTVAYEDKDLIANQQNFRDEYKISKLTNEIKELKDVVMRMDKKNIKIENIHLLDYMERMKQSGMNTPIVEEIAYEINADLKNIPAEDKGFIRGRIKSKLLEIIGEPNPINISGKGNVVIFVGPTGVGKTTTLAKLAAKLFIDEHYEIGLITADTYRIAAVEQLKIYGEILKLPIEVSYTTEEVLEAVKKFSNKDLIFIDTAGRSYKDIDQTNEIEEILKAVDTKEIYLVLNTTFSNRALITMLENYYFLNDYKLLITKLDESEGLGNIINMIKISEKDLSYFTDGQNVPDDIMLASPSILIDDILGTDIND